MFGLDPSIFWIAVAIGLAIIEAATVGLTVIWFSIGALAASVCAYVGLGEMVQFIVFLAVAVVCLIYTRPIVKDKLKVGKTATNLDRTIGKIGLVTEVIDNEKGTGQIKVGGLPWTARSKDNTVLAEGSRVKVVEIQGVKAIVVREE